MYVNDIAVAQ